MSPLSGGGRDKECDPRRRKSTSSFLSFGLFCSYSFHSIPFQNSSSFSELLIHILALVLVSAVWVAVDGQDDTATIRKCMYK
jgi:hypothetical protein